MIWLYLRWKEATAIIVLIACVGFIAFVNIKFQDVNRRVNSGFSPDWECTPTGKGSVCIKKPGSN
jgi:hypothetical protein